MRVNHTWGQIVICLLIPFHSIVFESQALRAAEPFLGKELICIKGHAGQVTSVAFSPDGKRVATVNAAPRKDRKEWLTGEIKLWAVESGRLLTSVNAHPKAIWCVAFSSDGMRLPSASSDCTVKIWDIATGKNVLVLQEHGVVRSVAFSQDGKRLASTGLGGIVTIWDAATRRVQHALGGHPERAWSVAFSPDGKRLASAGGILNETPGFKPVWEGGEVKVWDVGTGKEILSLKQQDTGEFYCVSFSPDGRHVAAGSYLGTVTIWDATTGRQTITRRNEDPVYGVAFSPDGERVAVAGGATDKPANVEIWDTATGKTVLVLPGHASAVTGVAFTADGTRLASSSFDGTLRVWYVGQGRHR
jgi:WD40 repeat protein